MSNQFPKVSFITVNYNGISHTENLLQTIFSSIATFDFEVIVIDNASVHNEFEALRKKFPRIRGEYLPQNLGFAGGNNRGMEIAQGEFNYFINNDTLLPTDADQQIQAMIDFCEKNPKVGGLSPKIVYHKPMHLIQFAGSTALSPITLRNKQIGYREMDKGQYNEIVRIPYFHGAAMFVPARVIRAVGKMPTCYFLYYEELDWSCSITQKFDLYYFPIAEIVHLESASTGIDSPLKTYYMTRNRIIFAYRQRTNSTGILTLGYLTLVAFPVHLFKFLMQCKLKHASMMIKGLYAGYAWITGLKR